MCIACLGVAMVEGKDVNHGNIVALTRDPWWIMRLIHYPARGVHVSSATSSGGGSADVDREHGNGASTAGGAGGAGGAPPPPPPPGGGGGGISNVDNDDGHATKIVDEGDGCGVHTDYGLLTIIGSQTPGVSALEVRDVEGRWLRADPPEGMFALIIPQQSSLHLSS